MSKSCNIPPSKRLLQFLRQDEKRDPRSSINRLKQSGSAESTDIQEAETKKAELELLLSEHRDVARESLKYYQEMKTKCASDWKEIQDLPNTEENHRRMELQHKFTLILSADYQMSKLLPYWGSTPQPSSMYYMQKVSYGLLGIVDHREEGVFICSMSLSDPRTQITQSHTTKAVEKF